MKVERTCLMCGKTVCKDAEVCRFDLESAIEDAADRENWFLDWVADGEDDKIWQELQGA